MSGCYKCWEGGGGLELVRVGAVGWQRKRAGKSREGFAAQGCPLCVTAANVGIAFIIYAGDGSDGEIVSGANGAVVKELEDGERGGVGGSDGGGEGQIGCGSGGVCSSGVY